MFKKDKARSRKLFTNISMVCLVDMAVTIIYRRVKKIGLDLRLQCRCIYKYIHKPIVLNTRFGYIFDECNLLCYYLLRFQDHFLVINHINEL